jgi:hypothetical protein
MVEYITRLTAACVVTMPRCSVRFVLCQKAVVLPGLTRACSGAPAAPPWRLCCEAIADLAVSACAGCGERMLEKSDQVHGGCNVSKQGLNKERSCAIRRSRHHACQPCNQTHQNRRL